MPLSLPSTPPLSRPLARSLVLCAQTGGHPVIPYMQRQNDNLNQEFAALLRDVDTEVPWAREVFGGAPEAVNLWYGDARASTSFHKDNYQNLYGVVAGEKVFVLLPPSDLYR